MQVDKLDSSLLKDKQDAINEVVAWYSITERDSENPDWRNSYPYGVSQLLSESGYSKWVHTDLIEHFASLYFNQPQGTTTAK